MSLESTWLGLLGGIVLPALGHAYHFVLAVNVTSGMGFSEAAAARIRNLLAVVLVATSALLLWRHASVPWWHWIWPLKGYVLLCVASGGLVLPLTSLALGLRRRPRRVSGRAAAFDLTARDGTDALVGTGLGARLLRVPGNESLRLRRHEWTLRYPGLAAGLQGLEILQISDLHMAPCYDRRFFERVVDACAEWSPDIVVITGDLVDDDDVLGWIEPVLGRLKARVGKFAILGNHDAECHAEGIVRELADAGFACLEGLWTTVERAGARISLGGTSAPWGPALDPREIPEADFRILLSHSPDQFYTASRWAIDLLLCGHNHGGQIRLPGFGPLFMPSIYSRRFDRGFFERGRMLMYVNEGVGGMHPLRYGCTPEVSHFVLTGDHDATDGGAPSSGQTRRAERGGERRHEGY
jgi:predicted MPP superfamily phosphohydrolase